MSSQSPALCKSSRFQVQPSAGNNRFREQAVTNMAVYVEQTAQRIGLSDTAKQVLLDSYTNEGAFGELMKSVGEKSFADLSKPGGLVLYSDSSLAGYAQDRAAQLNGYTIAETEGG